jgi:capsid protein
VNKFQNVALKWLGLSWLVDAANYRELFRRPFEPHAISTISEEVNSSDWYQLLSDSRKLYANLGPVTAAIDDKATYSIGRAWNAKFYGEDQTWGATAERWVNESWFPTADVRGGSFDFKTDLFIMSVATDRDGEIYLNLTESADGWPQIQLLPAHNIGQRDNTETVVSEGPYRGLKICQGVVLNTVGRPVAYNVLGETEDADEFISARDLIQMMDPRWCDQVRGFPLFMHALLDLRDLRTVQGYEKMAAMLMSSVGLIEWNEQGAPDPLDPANFLQRSQSQLPGAAPSVVTQDFIGGVARFFRSNSGSKLEQLKSDRPGDPVDKFMNRLIRNACVGAGWPYELTWDASALGGANVRLLIAKAMRSIEDRQDLIRPVARRAVGYAVAKAIKNGILKESDEWYKWRFTMPARMTADYGREAAADLADLEAGVTALSDILGEEGRDIDDHIAVRKSDNAKLVAAGLPPIATGKVAAAVVSTTGIKT